ncbi:MAG: amino acid permease [Clostridia bacterium]|nr:amino acid permease [Clostridia bacterium]
MKKSETGLSAWGLTMMALGTVIGGSFFLGSAIAIQSAGPSVLIAYILGGVLVYFILYALSEMTVADTAPGSFRTYAERAFGPGIGFVSGWVYWTGLILAMSSEAMAASVFLKTWFPWISIPAMGVVIIAVITLANLLGAEHLSKLEGTLAAVKLFAVAGFIVLAFVLISGLFPRSAAIGSGFLASERFFSGGIPGIAGSMLIVMFTYAGFEIIGLASSEAKDPTRTVPKAITYTVISLVTLYVVAIAVLLPLIPTNEVRVDVSPFVAALSGMGISWAASVINIVLVTAILSTMLAATFGLARMLRSLAEEGHAPKWIRDRREIPYRGILFSGAAMLFGFGLAFLLPEHIYLFLVSSGGFALLFTYFIIVSSHFKFRNKNGCPPKGKCQLPWFPYSSWTAMLGLIAIIASMPLIPGQGSGLVAGLLLVAFFTGSYWIKKYRRERKIQFNKV